MKTTQHTPGPWIDIDAQTARNLPHRLIADCGTAGIVTRETGKLVIREHGEANAQFIVTACNCHYELLEACKAAESLLANITQLSQPNHAVMIGALVKAASDGMKTCRAAIQSAQEKE